MALAPSIYSPLSTSAVLADQVSARDAQYIGDFVMMRQVCKIASALMVLLGAAACSTNSDAVRVLETENTSLRATLDAYKGYIPTMTAQATVMAQRIVSLQSTTTALNNQVKALTAQRNAAVAQGSNAGANPGGANP